MLVARIYRTGLVVTALALVVLGFSLRSQQGALNPTLAPDAFNDQNVYANLTGAWGQAYPDRRPGSVSDDNLATNVAQTFRGYRLSVSTDTFPARTVEGNQPLTDVVGVWPGIQSGSIVVVAARDAPGLAGLSATATLEELARDLEGETVDRSVVLASTSGSAGTAGAIHLASSLTGPVDAVIVLGDVAGAGGHISQPIVVPWSSRQAVAPPVLRNTVAAAVAAQAGIPTAGTGFGGQFAHLAFPFTLGQQAPFIAQGVPAVELSLSGDRAPGADEPISQDTIRGMGRAILEIVSALNSGPAVPAPAPYLLLSGQMVPGSAISLFVLALLLPVVLTMVDGVARVRRRGHIIWRSLVAVLAAAIPFLAGVLVILVARLAGVISVAPPGPVAPGAIPLSGTAIATLAVAVLAAAASAAGVRVLVKRTLAAAVRPRSRRAAPERTTHGAAAALLLAMCALTIVIWVGNPFAALLLVPALHLWMWGINPDLRLPAAARAALVLLGVAPVALVAVYYANAFGYSPPAAVWQAALLLAGHGVSLVAVVEWCVALGCLVGAGTVVVLTALAERRAPAIPAPITVRGPVTYAGPGSLGGTESALRR